MSWTRKIKISLKYNIGYANRKTLSHFPGKMRKQQLRIGDDSASI